MFLVKLHDHRRQQVDENVNETLELLESTKPHLLFHSIYTGAFTQVVVNVFVCFISSQAPGPAIYITDEYIGHVFITSHMALMNTRVLSALGISVVSLLCELPISLSDTTLFMLFLS